MPTSKPTRVVPIRPIQIRSVDGQSFEFNPPDALWFDMLAYCEAAGITLEELIKRSLADYFKEKRDE